VISDTACFVRNLCWVICVVKKGVLEKKESGEVRILKELMGEQRRVGA
jgi:hypothetical protein